jgi:hypothetical protein
MERAFGPPSEAGRTASIRAIDFQQSLGVNPRDGRTGRIAGLRTEPIPSMIARAVASVVEPSIDQHRASRVSKRFLCEHSLPFPCRTTLHMPLSPLLDVNAARGTGGVTLTAGQPRDSVRTREHCRKRRHTHRYRYRLGAVTKRSDPLRLRSPPPPFSLSLTHTHRFLLYHTPVRLSPHGPLFSGRQISPV